VSSSEIYFEKAGLIEMLNPTNLKPGEEQHETFVAKTSKKKLVQYDYRALDGELFSCVKATLADCHLFRDAWLEKTGRN